MSELPPPPGGWKRGDNRHEARATLRLWNGDSVRVRARGTSISNAENNLKARCTERLGTRNTSTLTTTSRLSAVIEEWIQGKDDVRPQTMDRYRTAIDNHIAPALGKIRINEVSPSMLDTWITDLAKETPGVVGNVRSVLKGVFRQAYLWELTRSDLMHSIKRTSGSDTKNEVRALDLAEIQPFRALIQKSGNQTLMDVTDLSLATGLRAGEVLALRWTDIDLEHEPPLMNVTGTVVYSKETGLIRQSATKSDAGHRPIQLPAVAVDILTRRKAEFGALPMVFPSTRGDYMHEGTVNAWLRKWRGKEFEWVTIHSLRKTLASIISDELGPHKAADVLGHADSRLTERVYVMKNRRGVPIGDVVDKALKESKNSPNIARNQ